VCGLLVKENYLFIKYYISIQNCCVCMSIIQLITFNVSLVSIHNEDIF
jgi:hypothetical protein